MNSTASHAKLKFHFQLNSMYVFKFFLFFKKKCLMACTSRNGFTEISVNFQLSALLHVSWREVMV